MQTNAIFSLQRGKEVTTQMYLLEELQNDKNSSRRKMNMEERRCKKKPWTMYMKDEICM